MPALSLQIGSGMKRTVKDMKENMTINRKKREAAAFCNNSFYGIIASRRWVGAHFDPTQSRQCMEPVYSSKYLLNDVP